MEQEQFFETIQPIIDEVTLLFLKIQQMKKKGQTATKPFIDLYNLYESKRDDLIAKIIVYNEDKVAHLLNIKN